MNRLLFQMADFISRPPGFYFLMVAMVAFTAALPLGMTGNASIGAGDRTADQLKAALRCSPSKGRAEQPPPQRCGGGFEGRLQTSPEKGHATATATRPNVSSC
jgi:hypothetical protein